MPNLNSCKTVGAALLVAALLPTASLAQTQSRMMQTAEQSYRQSDRALNTVYNQLMARLGPKTQTSLRQAQRSWLKYRDDNCAFAVIGVRGGSAESMVRYSCLMQTTMTRTQELNRHLNCREGDVACVRR